MSEGTMSAFLSYRMGQRSMLGWGRERSEGGAPTTRRQRYDRDAR
jgi:hypothetical protein